MNFKSVIHSHIQDHKDVVNHLDEETIKKIEEVSNLLVDCLSNGKTIFWCGNGGSAGDSQHLAAELIGRYKNDRRPLRSIALTTDSSAITCISNDYSYDKVFERQIEGLGTKGDVLIGISTSGNSFNVINAVNKANNIGVTTVCMLGNNGGAANEIADHSIIINSQSTARIQEMHIFVGHIFCDLIEHGLSLK